MSGASSTTASSVVGGADESTFFEYARSPSLLITGQNVIAGEIHQSVGNSSDISFDATCNGSPSACIELIGRASTALRIDGKLVPKLALPLHARSKTESAH